MFKKIVFFLFLMIALSACRNKPTADAEQATTLPYKLVCLGSTLTIGDTLDPLLAYPHRLRDLLAAQGDTVRVVNAAIHGETIAGASERVPWLLQQRLDGLLLELGSLEQQQGMTTDSIQQQLSALCARIQTAQPLVDIFVLDLMGGLSLPEKVQVWQPDFVVDYTQITPEQAERIARYLAPLARKEVEKN